MTDAPARVVARSALLAVVVAVASLWSIVYTRGVLGFSTLWIAGGIVTGHLLSTPRRAWWPPLVAACVAMLGVNAWRNGWGPVALVLSAANLFEAWFVAAVISRRIGDASSLRVIKRSTATATLATLVACSISGLVAAIARNRWTHAPAPMSVLFLTWLGSHALGMAIFATLTIAARVEGRRLLGQPGRRLELALTLALIAADCWLVFSQSRYGLAFLLFPPLLLCVFRHRFSGFVYASAIIALVATTLTAQGLGPFYIDAESGSYAPTLILQAFLASVCLVAFPMATVLTERRLLLHRVGESEHAYRLLADHSSDLIGHIGADGKRRYISPSVTELLGYSREDFAQVRRDLVHPDDRGRLDAAFNEVLRSGRDATELVRIRHRDGRELWFEVKARCVRDGEGARDGAAGIVYAARDVTRRVVAERALERLARHDTLTGLANRLHFGEQLDLAIARSQRHQRPMAVLYFDIDHFKAINDSHGHEVGDHILQAFSERLRACLRNT